MSKQNWIGTWVVTYSDSESDELDTHGSLYADDHLFLNEDGTFKLEYTGGNFFGKWKTKGKGLVFSELEQLGGDTLQEIKSEGRKTIRATVTDDEHGITIWYKWEKKK